MTIQPQNPADPNVAARLREREALAKNALRAEQREQAEQAGQSIAPTDQQTLGARMEAYAEQRARDMGTLQGRDPVIPFKARAESIARAFHETYERMAPDHGYETRTESAVPWSNVPEQNRHLMCAVVEHLLRENVIR